MSQIRAAAITGPTAIVASGTKTIAKPKPVKPRTRPPAKAASAST
jgi:hypothetical protein